MKYCESCGMFLVEEDEIGTNADGSKNEEYCIYCFEGGKYTVECTMEEMIRSSVKHMKESGVLEQQGRTEEEAKGFMKSFFSDLKRWKSDE